MATPLVATHVVAMLSDGDNLPLVQSSLTPQLPEAELPDPVCVPDLLQQPDNIPDPMVIAGTHDIGSLTDDSPDHDRLSSVQSAFTPHLSEADLPEPVCVPGSAAVDSPDRGNFAALKQELSDTNLGDYCLIQDTDDKLVYASFYNGSSHTVKTTITVTLNGTVSVLVHGRELSKSHEIWGYLPQHSTVTYYVKCLIERIKNYTVCMGNPDEDMVELTPVGAGLTLPNSVGLGAYREGDFNAKLGNVSYSSTIRHTDCSLLVEGVRCSLCRRVRDGLRARRNRQRHRSMEIKPNTPNQFLSPEEKDLKLKSLSKDRQSLRRRVSVLEDQVDKLKAEINKQIETDGEALSGENSGDLIDIMKSSDSYIRKPFGDNSFQRIFFEQQAKYNELRNKKGMRWHPMIIRWCLYLRSKSAKAYDGMRHVLALPSQRSLFDYSNATEAGTGFKNCVTKQLVKESEKLNLYDTEHKQYVGIVQDEVRIKSDLVFNKHTGELVGFVDLDKVGNELNDLEQTMRGNEQVLARYMLVVMIRGITSSLQYPLAAFATDGITADFLYPIIWKAIEIVEVHVELKVLFICCDGASPNRKFFSLHSANADSTLYKTDNPFGDTGEQIYFISDAPHLLKTTRNCFSNSFHHKRSRLLWNGGNISWRHIVRLFDDHCSGPLRLCKKLSHQHVNLTPFSIMKVNLAAQVMSNTVARALEHKYPDVEHTVNFIDMINKWFDIMNSRSLHEANRTRNPNVAPFFHAGDPRLQWLTDDFLPYFVQWSGRIDHTFPHLSKSEKAAMKLSHQTLNGLHITTKSIVECVRFLLEKGASFIMTEHFNQDPLERHFGHYRQKGGMNENPTVWQVCHTLNQVRTVKCQGLAPKRGNVRADLDDAIDDTPLPRRQRHETV